MTNGPITTEALRLMADRRMRMACFMLWAMIALTTATVWRASATDAFTGTWFAAGMLVGATIAAFGNIISIATHHREMRESQEQAREAAALVADCVTDELHARGDEFEATLEPSGLITIHRRGRPDPRARMH